MILKYLLQKEFRQIFRNRIMLPFIFLVPIVQMLVLVYAATLEIKSADIIIVDNDRSLTSQQYISKIEASDFFNLYEVSVDNNNTEEYLQKGFAKAVIIIPQDFGKDLTTENYADIQLNIDAVDGQSAGLIKAYLQQISVSLVQDLMTEKTNTKNSIINTYTINSSSRFWYNPELNFKHYMLPGILVILVSMIGIFLTALNIVTEREIGTLEQISVTPIKSWQFLLGKMLPFLLIGLFDMALGLGIGKLIFNVPFEGKILHLLVATLIYLFCTIGLGVLMATFAKTQQQVMFTVFLFFIIFVFTSGLFTPVESMPDWAQKIIYINPLYYFMRILRMLMLKGSELIHFSRELISLSIYGVVLSVLAIRASKRLA